MFAKKIIYTCCAVYLLAALLAAPSFAYKVVGKVTNGTSGRSDVAADIELVNPRGGMQVEQKLRAENGAFIIEDLSDTSHVYVIRTFYQGVSYSGIIRQSDSDTTFYDVTVYDTTSAFTETQVYIPHLMIRRTGEHYRFDTIYDIVNNTDPAKTITDKPFRLYMPDDRVSVNALYTTELGLPINRDPIQTDIKGIYRIDSPLKPGTTRLALSFDVHAHDGAYEYEQTLPYDIESINILVEDPEIDVKGETIRFEKSKREQGGVIYSASSLAASSRLAFRVSGGSAEPVPSASQNMQIITQSKATEGGSIPIILIVTLFLLALPFLSSRKPASGRQETGLAESRRNQLLGQIARLDDLYAAGTVAEALYQAKRTELKYRLAYIMQHAGASKAKSPRKSKKIKKDS